MGRKERDGETVRGHVSMKLASIINQYNYMLLFLV